MDHRCLDPRLRLDMTEGVDMPYTVKKAKRAARNVVPIYFEIPVDMRDGLRRLANAEDRSLGSIVRRAVAAELARSEHGITKVGAP